MKRYLDEQEGTPVDSIWTDIPPVQSQSSERLGYPTQKPLALLERIVSVSSNKNDIVLDAFCGCGTALVAAEKLGRQWIGIDVSPTACKVMEKRLLDTFRDLRSDEDLRLIGRGFAVRNLPWSEEKLRVIPPFEFENWAVIALGGMPNKAKVGDQGIDGRIFFPASVLPERVAESAGKLDYMDNWDPIQVKQKDKVGRPDIDAFETAMERAGRRRGVFVTFDYTSDATEEITACFKRNGRIIIPLTVKEILDGDFARKLA